MLTNKVFIRKTKRGNILKIVREHYLRTDIWCGVPTCNKCQAESFFLSESPETASTLFEFPHYLIPDTNIILDQIDVLEQPTLTNCIILQTVLDEVKHKSSSVYKRLRDVISLRERNIYTFVNEHHKDTYVERQPGETANNRNDRAIRVAVKWYDEHLDGTKIRAVLLTDDVENRQIAQDNGLLCSSIRDYIGSRSDCNQLFDILSQKNYIQPSAVDLFPAHYSIEQIHTGIKAGQLLQGQFLGSRENYLEGTVIVSKNDEESMDVLIQGQPDMNRAVDGDVVAIELYPKEKWSSPMDVVMEEDEQENDENAEKLLDVDKIKRNKTVSENAIPTGRVVGVIRRKWRQYCGILRANLIAGTTRHIFVPAERKIPRVRVETRQASNLIGQKILVAIDAWPRNSRYPVGHFVRALGAIGDKATENEVILLEHDVPHSKFSEEVLACLPEEPWSITDEEIAKRVDLRNIAVCSVDPPGCTDIDDALHCIKLKDGDGYEVGVHIADVTHFIRPCTAIDKEAASRGTTVYLADKRIDMVPMLLSSDLCSLRSNRPRYAFSVVWKIDEEANIVETKFQKSLIESKAALTYEQAQILIDDSTQNTDICQSLRHLNRLAKILKSRRLANGALILAAPEIRFEFDAEHEAGFDIQAKVARDTNSMVEEFMLLANFSVAEKISQEFPEFAVLRRHPKPPASNFAPLIKAAENAGFEIDCSSGESLAKSLDEATKPSDVYFNTMLRILTTRCMLQAQYFISGESSGQSRDEFFFHYGLAAKIYTHFTSPIRRYADVMVHRLLAACIGADSTYPELLDRRANTQLCNNLNYRNRMAQYAGRASVALNTHLFFRGKQQEEDGYILFVRKNAIQILIPKFGLEGVIYLKQKDKKSTVNFVYNEQEHTQVCCSVTFHAFDPVRVRLSLDSTNVQRERLIFELVTPFIEGFSVSPIVDAKAVKDVDVKKESPSLKREVKQEQPSSNKKNKKHKK